MYIGKNDISDALKNIMTKWIFNDKNTQLTRDER